jgi:hypothetical protein
MYYKWIRRFDLNPGQNNPRVFLGGITCSLALAMMRRWYLVRS